MNNVVMMGRLTRDPELRHTQSGTPVASFCLAVNRKFKKDGEPEADFINFITWRHTAEFVSKYFTKGQQMAVTGRLQVRSYTDKDGNKRTAVEVIVDNAYFAEGKRSADAEPRYTPAAQTNYDEVDEDDDGTLPF